jgi:phosphate acetyltransferase
MSLCPAPPIRLEQAQAKLEQGLDDQLMEEVIDVYRRSTGKHDVMIIEGLSPSDDNTLAMRLNAHIAQSLDCDVIVVSAQGQSTLEQLEHRIRRCAKLLGGVNNERLIGAILNRVGEPPDAAKPFHIVDACNPEPAITPAANNAIAALPVFTESAFKPLGLIPWQPGINAPRVFDVHRYLNTDILNEGEIMTRRIAKITLCASSIRNSIDMLVPGALVVTPGDRDDIFVAACFAACNGVPIAGILLTSDTLPAQEVLKLCQSAWQAGLPVLHTPFNPFTTAKALDNMDVKVPWDDTQRMEAVMTTVAEPLAANWLKKRAQVPHETRVSPAAFRYALVERARANPKRIILPEGQEPRTLRAAIYCQQQGIAHCVLLGDPDTILSTAQTQGLILPTSLEIIRPENVRTHYISPMVALRQHKGLTEPMAEAQLEDPTVLGTMMLAMGAVDGLVSGTISTTANTVRPALQLIKTKPDATLVSSVFFMCLPEQVVVYGDCAINPDPDAEALADIAIQSADSAAAFGLAPRIAMISYATGSSSTGSDVDKVLKATQLAKAKRPDLLIDGPLQYDAASVASVAANKAPNSPVAGRATVFIFPDLNTGNTTYKAVQRSASVVSIGPMLQGLNKPVNDLSRGALVEDIVYTIALTAIQSMAAPPL